MPSKREQKRKERRERHAARQQSSPNNSFQSSSGNPLENSQQTPSVALSQLSISTPLACQDSTNPFVPPQRKRGRISDSPVSSRTLNTCNTLKPTEQNLSPSIITPKKRGRPPKRLSSLNSDSILRSSFSESDDSSSVSTPFAKLRGRPKKLKDGRGRPRKISTIAHIRSSTPVPSIIGGNVHFHTPSSTHSSAFPSNLQQPELIFPNGHLVSAANDIIATDTFLTLKDLMSELWRDPGTMFDNELIYVYLRYICSISLTHHIIVVKPDYTDLRAHDDPTTFPPMNLLENCYNYSPEYDILLIPVFFPGHFALLIFDRTDRTSPQCIFADPLPGDRLSDAEHPSYSPDRFILLVNIIRELTLGLDSSVYVRNLSEFELTMQLDGVNCGFFTVLYAEAYIFNKRRLILTPININYERRRILWHLAQLFSSNNVPYFGRNYSANPPIQTANPAQIVVGNIVQPNETEENLFSELSSDSELNFVISPHKSSRRRKISSDTGSESSDAPILRRSPRLQSRSPTPIMQASNNSNRPQTNVITQRCYVKHDGLPCGDVRVKHTTQYYDSGNLGDKICDFCSATYFNSEPVKKKRKISSNMCCDHGKVKLPPFKEHPPLFKRLLSTDSKESKEFLKHQNIYNSLLSFSSVSVSYQESSLDGSVCFLLNGEFVRMLSSTLPLDKAPSFSQYYILDPETALEHRTQSVKYGGDRVDEITLRKLDFIVRKYHPLAKELINFHKQYKQKLDEQGPEAVKNFRLTLLEARDAPEDIRDPSLHERQTNLPTEGDTLFALWTETDVPPKLKGIWITNDQGVLFKYPPHHPLTDTLCYPLLFPCGDDGYHRKIPYKAKPQNDTNQYSGSEEEDSENESIADSEISSTSNVPSDSSTFDYGAPKGPRKFISVRDYIRYRMAIRNNENLHHIWSAGGGLNQKFILDYAARIDSDVADFLRQPEFNMRNTLPENAVRWLARNAGLSNPQELGSIVLFRKSNPGTRPYFQEKYYDAMAIMHSTAKPGYASFMLTFTANPNWPEIKRNMFHKRQKIANRFDLICRIYEDKKKELHYLLEHRNLLGKMVAFGESREFQKRYGGPHLHRVYRVNILAIPENVENLIWAHIPPEPPQNDHSDWANFIRKIRELITKFQLHDCSEACKNSRGRCKKGFPKPFSKFTHLYDDRPAQYIRLSPEDGGEILTVKRGSILITYDNSRVVAFNPYLLVRFETHVNLEYSWGPSLKYAMNYGFKGGTISYLKSREVRGQTSIDEPAFYAKKMYRSPTEAYTRIMSFKYTRLSHTVLPLTIHLPGKQKVFIPRGQEQAIAQQIQSGILPETPLTVYWKLCDTDPEIQFTLFERMPEKYSFDKSNKTWKKRKASNLPYNIKKRKPIIGRLYTVSPRDPERYALYLLMKHFPGNPTQLKTIANAANSTHPCTTFLEAARMRGLIEDSNVWIRTLEEAVTSLKPTQMRQLFANILIFGSTENCVIDGAMLWERFIDHMFDNRCTPAERPGRIERALALIERLLVAQGKQNSDFGLPTPTVSILDDPNQGLDQFFFPQHVNDDDEDETVDATIYERANLNAGQREFFELVLSVINGQSPHKLLQLTGDGGTGKTYLLNFVLYHLRVLHLKVIPTASTGMASTRFYSGGTTFHSAFRLGIDIEPGRIPSIPFDSFMGRKIIEAHLIILDEMSMIDKVAFENVSILCQTLRRNNKPFGDIPLIISGDFKLTVVLDWAGTAAQISACLQSSHLYPLFHKFKLTDNMRLDPDQQEFQKWLKDIGTGALGDKVPIPKNMLVNSREELINWVFNTGFNIPSKELLKRLILSSTNRIVDINNDIVQDSLSGNYFDYHSADKALQENPFAINAAAYDVSNLNQLQPLGMPPHHLRLKVGAIVVLFMNLNTRKGFCNGTRMIIRKLSPNLIEAETINPNSSRPGVIIGIARCRFTHMDKRHNGVSFERLQFPLRAAFAMTTVKAQGQTIQRLGIDFTTEPFSHGQLYTTLSRCPRRDGIRIYAPNKELDENGCPLIRNVVARGLNLD